MKIGLDALTHWTGKSHSHELTGDIGHLRPGLPFPRVGTAIRSILLQWLSTISFGRPRRVAEEFRRDRRFNSLSRTESVNLIDCFSKGVYPKVSDFVNYLDFLLVQT